MRKLLNTLYVTTPESYLALDGENVVLLAEDKEKFRIPFVNIENIVCFNYMGVSPALMGKCADVNIPINFLAPSGKFLAKITGGIRGNVLLRRQQYRFADDDVFSLKVSKNIIGAKLHNSRFILNRTIRDHNDIVDTTKIQGTIEVLENSIQNVYEADNVESIRGIEGESARIYFTAFNEMILKQKSDFILGGRTKRPPLDMVNAMLSYMYTILGLEVQSALETVGLDPYVGFMHTDRSGRASLALDLIEELRAYMVDRLVVSMINLLQISKKDFLEKEGGAFIFENEGRRKILQCWQTKKNDVIRHPIINEKIPIGLIPYVQAQLLSRHIRGDLEEYQPFICR